MSKDHHEELKKKLWTIANDLRGKMEANEFKDYILGLIFYKFLSEKVATQITTLDPSFSYDTIHQHSEYEEIKNDCIKELGYFLEYKYSFLAITQKGESGSEILGDLELALKTIQDSTIGTDSQEDFDGLFESIDLTSNKLGQKNKDKNALILKVLTNLKSIDFKIENTEIDVLGDAYEYLIANFASSAGKKAGEFYTPQSVSKILSKIVNIDNKVASIYDPTCGSGSLLLRASKESTEVNRVMKYYGQELTPTTYNLARMNMLLHGVKYDNFHIYNDDTLEHPCPKNLEIKFDAIVANPPFSANWNPNEDKEKDERFRGYGKLVQKGKADFAFIQHMIHHLGDTGTMAVVVPHGVLFRSGAEGTVRQHIIEKLNYLDAVIGLPEKLFFGTGIPTAILVFKKNRDENTPIHFIDSSNFYNKGKNQNELTNEHIDKMVDCYTNRNTIDKYSNSIKIEEIKENDFNLNIPRYVDTFEDEVIIDLSVVADAIAKNTTKRNVLEGELSSLCGELGVPTPF